MKFLKVIGYFFIFLSVLLIFISYRYNILNDRYSIKCFLPICSLGFFLLAYDAFREEKKSEENFELRLFTTRKSIFMCILMGVLLLFCSIFI